MDSPQEDSESDILYVEEINPIVERTKKGRKSREKRAYRNAVSRGCREFRILIIVVLIHIAPAFCHFELGEKSHCILELGAGNGWKCVNISLGSIIVVQDFHFMRSGDFSCRRNDKNNKNMKGM